MKKFLFFILIILLVAPIAVGAGSNSLALNKAGQLSAEQIKSMEFYYIEIMDTGTLRSNARQKMIINAQTYYGE